MKGIERQYDTDSAENLYQEEWLNSVLIDRGCCWIPIRCFLRQTLRLDLEKDRPVYCLATHLDRPASAIQYCVTSPGRRVRRRLNGLSGGWNAT